jgi:multiple sugar transport system substrate-binding protein
VSGPATSGPSASPKVGGAPEPVSFIVFGDPAELAAYRALVDAFGVQRPDVDVELVHIPDQRDYRERLGNDFAAGTPADVMLINYRRFAAFADTGAIAPLGGYLERSTLIDESDFYPEAIEPFAYSGELWCIPQNLSSLVVYYNTALFDAAGVAYPAPDWTWQDLLRAARTLTRDADRDGTSEQFGLGTEASLNRLAPFIWQNGGTLVDFAGRPTRLAIDRPRALDAIRFFVELQTVHHVVPNAVEEASEDSETRFQNGRMAMFLNSRRGVPSYREITGFSWDVAALPRNKEAAGILHSDAFCMAAASRSKDAAWAFIEFASSAAGQTILARSGRTVPSLKAVATSPAFLDPAASPRSSRVFLDTIPAIRRVPVHPAWVDVETTSSEELERAFYGQVSVEEAIRVAVERSIEEFER